MKVAFKIREISRWSSPQRSESSKTNVTKYGDINNVVTRDGEDGSRRAECGH